MPVTVYPASHPSEPCSLHNLLRNAAPQEVLRTCLGLKWKAGQTNPIESMESMYASSFDNEEYVDVYASANGFVHSAIRAYNAHHHLRIRPDDVWIAILTQLSIYVNKHAEALRSVFVEHGGQKPLDIKGAVIDGVDGFASRIAEVLSKNVKDPSIPKWIMQDFSTTTPADRIAAGIIMMATFQSYFKYYEESTCGLPSVTLLGDRADWVKLLKTADRLSTFVPKHTPSVNASETVQNNPTAQMKKWISVLKPVLSRFVNTFDAPNSVDTINFWQQIVDYRMAGSGASYMSGWLTAFCFWMENGECIFEPDRKGSGRSMLSLDGVIYASIDWEDVPPGSATVPLEVYDNFSQSIFKCRMLAGSVGISPFLAQIEDHGTINKLRGKFKRQQDVAEQGRKKDPRKSSSKSKGYLRPLLSCCGLLDASNDSESHSHTLPAPKRTSKKLPLPNVTLPSYSERQESDPAVLPPYNGEGAIQDYESSPKFYLKKEQPPPEYKLDGLQPRVGWFIWVEEVVRL